MILPPMKHARPRSARGLLAGLRGLASARVEKQPEQEPDHPRLTPGVTLRDVRFHSPALNREMPYRIILPSHSGPAGRWPVVYLLHGLGGGFCVWSNYSDVARFAEA